MAFSTKFWGRYLSCRTIYNHRGFLRLDIILPMENLTRQQSMSNFAKFGALKLDIFFQIDKEKCKKCYFEGIFLCILIKNGSSSKDFRAFLAYFLEKYVTLHRLYPRCANQEG